MAFWRLTLLVISTFGIYAFGSLLVFSFRAEPAAESSGRSGSRAARLLANTMLALCLVWFVVQLVLTLLELSPGAETGWFQLARLALAFAFPPLIMALTYVEVQDRGRPLAHPLWRGLLGFGLVAGPAAGLYWCLAIFHVVPRVKPLGAAIGISIGLAFALASVYSAVAMSVGRQARESAAERSGRRSMTALYGALVALVALATLAGFARLEITDLLNAIGGAMPLLFCLTSLYHESRFEFLDLFVKGGALFLVALVALTACFALALPRIDATPLPAARPWLLALVLLPLVMATPWVKRRLSRWLDAVWLGRQLGPAEATKRFLGDLDRALTEGDLVAEAERGLGAIFGARVTVLLDPAPSDVTPERAMEVPIRRGETRVGRLLLGPRADQRPYFSEDATLAASLGEVLAHLLENVRLQARRQEQEQLARELRFQASRSELKALRAQINPHFLFNALNAIAGLIHHDPARADRTVEQLAEIFRYTLRGSDEEWALVEDELDFVRAYLDVERARFGHRLEVRVTTAPEVAGARIPTMLVQTLVENAVKHGVAVVRGPARIEVVACREGERLRIEVVDSGPGFPAPGAPAPPRRAAGPGYGLRNVRERLRGHFGDRAELVTGRDAARGLTSVALLLPVERAAAARPEIGGAA